MADEHHVPFPPLPSMVIDKDDDYADDGKDPKGEPETKLATVKMLLQSIDQTVTVAFPLHAPVNELVTHFAKELRMPVSVLQILFRGEKQNAAEGSIIALPD